VLGKAYDEAVAADRYDIARQLGKLAAAAAYETRDPIAKKSVADKLKRLSQLEADYAKIKDALAILETKPTHPDANLAVGKYRCFVRGDWENGLPNLALGSDPVLQKLAEQEVVMPDSASDQAKLADGWWEFAEKEKDAAAKKLMQQRAGYWYKKAAPSLTGLAQVRTKKRLEQLAKLEKTSTSKDQKPVNLLALIDVKRDAVHGTWKTWEGTLVSPKLGGARLQIPYVPPAEYDVVVEVTRLDGPNGLTMGLVAGGRQFLATVDGWESKVSGLQLVDGKRADDNVTRFSSRVLTTGRKSTIVYNVRKAGVQMTAGGKRIVSWAGDFNRLSLAERWRVPKRDCLFVLTTSTVCQIHRMTLIPVKSSKR